MPERTYHVNNPYFEDIMNKSDKKDFSRLISCLCILIVITVWMSGCAAPGESRAEIRQRHLGIVNVQMQQIQNDWDALFLLNKSSKLSDMYVR